ncbi:MAG: hypothetical protein H8E31_16115 [Planctomycetes bacterium]|nr:hypothetical protein [Planctomycetota bacterium]
MKSRLWLLLAPLAALGCQTANGPTFQEGTARSSFEGSWSTVNNQRPAPQKDLEVVTLDTAFSAGAFVTPEIEAGLRVGFFDQDADTARLRAWDAALYGRYYLQSHGTLRPWGEGRLGYSGGRSQGVSDRTIFWGVGAGLTQFLTESTALELSLAYEARTFDFGGGDTDVSSTALSLAYAVFW